MDQVGDEKLVRPLFWSKVLLVSVLAHVAIVIGLIYEPLLYQNVSFLNDLVQRFGDWTEWGYLGASNKFGESMRTIPLACIPFIFLYSLSYYKNFDLYIIRWKPPEKSTTARRIVAAMIMLFAIYLPVLAFSGRRPGPPEDPNFVNSGLYGFIPNWPPTFLLEIIGYSLLSGYTFGFVLYIILKKRETFI